MNGASEKQEQAAVVALYRRMGCLVFNLSQPRETMQSPGLPDLWVFAPRRAAAFWHEVKRDGGEWRPEQVGFAQLCQHCGVGFVSGGVQAARAQLERLGIVAKVGAA